MGEHHESAPAGRGRRSSSKLPFLAAVGVGIAVFGVGAGALLSTGGDEDGGQQDDQAPVSASAPAEEATPTPTPTPTVDPVKAQAVELDKLLSDSNGSRASVIKAVGDIKSCTNLGAAARDLRDAAEQRTALVTRLDGLTIDKLPNNDRLGAALKKAWEASASADTHYAAWADQVAGKKGCKGGTARVTGQTAAGNRASGTAGQAKQEAADLWNPIAAEHGLAEHSKDNL